MLLQKYLRQPDHVLARIRFDYLDGHYKGRGVITWDPRDGYHMEAPVKRTGPALSEVGFGRIGIIREEDVRSIRMKKINSRGWIVAPEADKTK